LCASPEIGFKLHGEDLLDWWKYLFWTKGISTNEFRRCQIRDIKTVMEIDNVICEKKNREKAVQKAMSNVKW